MFRSRVVGPFPGLSLGVSRRCLWTSRFSKRLPIRIIDNVAAGEEIFSREKVLSEPAVGLAVNYRPDFLNVPSGRPGRVSLLQVATPSCVFLFQLFKFVQMKTLDLVNQPDEPISNGKTHKFFKRHENLKHVESSLKLVLPPAVISLLESETIRKVGYKISEQTSKLETDWNIPVNGSVDLEMMIGREYKYSLTQLCDYILDVDWEHHSMGLSFSNPTYCQKLHFSDWQANTLTQEQLIYAADEAAAPLQVYQKLQESFNKREDLDKHFFELEKQRILHRLLEKGHATVNHIRFEHGGRDPIIRDSSDFEVLEAIHDPQAYKMARKWKLQSLKERKKKK